MRCHWENDPKIGRWFLPVCWGGVMSGMDGCYCPRISRATLEDKVEKLEARIIALERDRTMMAHSQHKPQDHA
jgi:hypothetical protein